MRLSFRVAIVLVVCLAAMALPAAPVQANGAYITLDPEDGVPGVEVTIEGHNFTAHAELDIYYYRTTARVRVLQVEADGDGDFDETFVVPESYTGIHQVRAEVTSSNYTVADFTVRAGLTVSPEEGPVGTNVTVKGHGFAEDEGKIKLRYYLDGNSTLIAQNIVADGYGAWQKSFQVPLSIQGDHYIDAEGEESDPDDVEEAVFEVTPGISLNESSGSPGESITVTGTGFATGERDITILFDGESVETEIRANSTGCWQASFDVPEMPKGTYSVTAEGDYTQKEDLEDWSFKVEPVLVLPPGEGYVGMNLTVSGRGFAASKDVDVMYDGSKLATGRSNSKGSFNVTFAVPESQHGTRQVTAEDAAGNDATAIFTMESDRPEAPELIAPPYKSRVGFIGKATPTFQWSEVSDESGVRYGLQISSSANLTAAAGFADPIVSIPDMVGTNYTLNVTEALPYGTYYWIVRAVDRAGNVGSWTGPMSFRVGILPLWAFILAIVVIVAVIATLIHFFVLRKRVHYY